MGQRAFDETAELELRLYPLLRTRATLEGTYEARLESERGRIADEIVHALDALLTARGYSTAKLSVAQSMWTADGAQDASRSVTVSLPSSSGGTRSLRARVGAREVAFTVDHPSFAALAPPAEDPVALETPGDLSPSSPGLPTPPPDFMKSPQELDHQRYHARVARMKRDIAETQQVIAVLGLAISSFEAGGPYRFVSEGGDPIETVEALLDAILEA